MKQIVFVDSEIGQRDGRILDLGACDSAGRQLHCASPEELTGFTAGIHFIGGHNIIEHDLKYIGRYIGGGKAFVDTLVLSPLLFPAKPYHRLLKDDKLQTDMLNNPLNDAKKSQELFYDECEAFSGLDEELKEIYALLLGGTEQFEGFFEYIGYTAKDNDIAGKIRKNFHGRICTSAPLEFMSKNHPIELAYCLAAINTNDKYSITPAWVLRNYPLSNNYMRLLRGNPCAEGCEYCKRKLDVKARLKEFFGYDEFRTYNGEPLQQRAADAAVHNKSLLAVFPTGGGKSITFQLPALIAGESSKGLTVVISPLQSLMKDQVDNLSLRGMADAVTINAMLSPIERAEAYERVASGMASLLYISPESLRSKTIERLLLSRNVVRFVIDEAHCFSAWGQDFRVDYLYIGDFIKRLQELKRISSRIPVSCFTATAKQKVISDIRDYFKNKLDIDLDLYATSASRTNLHYGVLFKENDDDKYQTLRELIEKRMCPTIVYVSRTKRTFQLAQKLCDDGFAARPFNGKMESADKIANQEAFINGEVMIIVATSAFGMGVDKSDVGLVVHFDISDSLENYVQEAGRAGRDQSLEAECFVLFNEQDLDKHFMLLNQTKLSQSEIQQVWRAIKGLTRTRPFFTRSALEIARAAGWDDSVKDIETRVKTAVSALENAGYIKRGQNVSKVYASGILAHSMAQASAMINNSDRFDEQQKLKACRILDLLISKRSIGRAHSDDAESRLDYIWDMLGFEKQETISLVSKLKETGLLADTNDMTAYIKRTDTQNRSLGVLRKYSALEQLLISKLTGEPQSFSLKELNEQASAAGIKGINIRSIKTLMYYWTIKGYIEKTYSGGDRAVDIIQKIQKSELERNFYKRAAAAKFILEYLYELAAEKAPDSRDETLVSFSPIKLKEEYIARPTLTDDKDITVDDIQDTLLYLSKTEALTLEGGFLVLYNGMEIQRLELDNRIQYKNDDYKQLNDFYRQKIQQIHIVGEYANMMVKSYDDALGFVSDYFNMEYKAFLLKYFKGSRSGEINRNITPEKYESLFGALSQKQREIIDDDTSKYIVVAAGPGSGKTRVLVHKLASLMLLEDIKHEQLLMLTFSRAAATQFKQRLIELIGHAASFVEIKTFHSYCFDLLGKTGSLEDAENIVAQAARMIQSGEVEQGRITKTVVVIDEAQDMDKNEYMLIKALMEHNENMRVIAVGDDDQNIYQFRGADSKYMGLLLVETDSRKYELPDNYRSAGSIVSLSNKFAASIQKRLKSKLIRAVREDSGTVRVIKHISENLEYPIVRAIKANRGAGSICVLTNTNDEALRVTGLLKNQNIPARLIQSSEGFDLYDLAEMRMFLRLIGRDESSPIISDAKWNDALQKLQEHYNGSTALEPCIELLRKFEAVNERKYRSDLESFLHESDINDHYRQGKEEIIVSTIHKAKGREFDCVYLLLNNIKADTDEVRRRLYVAMTRARNELYIHCNNDIADHFAADTVTDPIIYPEPSEITLQLTHKGVVLDLFKGKKSTVFRLKSGDELIIDGKCLYAIIDERRQQVAVLSKAAKETIDRLTAKGYRAKRARVRFIVAWKGEKETSESAVILPDIELVKE